MTTTLDDVIDDAVKIVSLPDIVHRLDNAINDPYSDLSDIAAIIGTDPGLSARILKIANSAMFSFPARIETVTYAVSIIGTKQLRDLVFASCVIDVFKDAFKPGVDLATFWKHSIATGITSRVLATYRREPNVERFYLIGLMHDIGKLVLHMKTPELAREAIYTSRLNNQLLHVAESDVLGFDHAAAGGALLKAWNLPESFHEPVRYHHLPRHARSYRDETAIVHMADIVANALIFSANNQVLVPPLSPQAWDLIGISENALEGVVEQIDHQFTDAVQLFMTG